MAGGEVSPQAPRPAPDFAEHIAALLASERAQSERERRRRRLTYVWVPFGIAVALGLPTLLWMLTRIR